MNRAHDPDVIDAARKYQTLIELPNPTAEDRSRMTEILINTNVPEDDLLEIRRGMSFLH
ncbi:hypothetical protein KW799_02520 [Candidatus Parcubacteria bacterium]|nr:hypothetical protein [Candidatus Parcubacteria bacterium]